MEESRAPWPVMIPPPAYYGVAFGAGMLLDHFAEFAPGWIEHDVLRWVGWALVAFGVLVAPFSAVLFGVRRTTLNPAGHPSRLVTSGAFNFTRNPMYLALTGAYAGLSLALEKAWPLLLLPLPVLLMNAVVIPFEEGRMRERFGQAYLDYCKRVRRWM